MWDDLIFSSLWPVRENLQICLIVIFLSYLFQAKTQTQAWFWFLIIWKKMTLLGLCWSSLREKLWLQSLTRYCPTGQGQTPRLRTVAGLLCTPCPIRILLPRRGVWAPTSDPGWTLEPQTGARVHRSAVASTPLPRSAASAPCRLPDRGWDRMSRIHVSDPVWGPATKTAWAHYLDNGWTLWPPTSAWVCLLRSKLQRRM